MFASLNLDNLVAKFRAVNSLSEGESRKRFLEMLAVVTGKHPRLAIVGIFISRGTVRFKIENGVVFRFEDGNPVPIQEIPSDKFGRPKEWFRSRENAERIFEQLAEFEVLVEKARAEDPAIFRSRNPDNKLYQALCDAANTVHTVLFRKKQGGPLSGPMQALESRFREQIADIEVRVVDPAF